jgi:hypothetical protein
VYAYSSFDMAMNAMMPKKDLKTKTAPELMPSLKPAKPIELEPKILENPNLNICYHKNCVSRYTSSSNTAKYEQRDLYKPLRLFASHDPPRPTVTSSASDTPKSTFPPSKYKKPFEKSDSKCYKCGGKGHFARNCTQSSDKADRADGKPDQKQTAERKANVITRDGNLVETYLPVKWHGRTMHCLLDAG